MGVRIEPADVTTSESIALSDWFGARGVKHVRAVVLDDDAPDLVTVECFVREGNRYKVVRDEENRTFEMALVTNTVRRGDCPIPERFLAAR